ncbi:MAG: hypothetical protein FWC00_04155 [Firmicutes bacterium]|nr:hypothetical protein [Bacillota bacterium]
MNKSDFIKRKLQEGECSVDWLYENPELQNKLVEIDDLACEWLMDGCDAEHIKHSDGAVTTKLTNQGDPSIKIELFRYINRNFITKIKHEGMEGFGFKQDGTSDILFLHGESELDV